MARLLFRLKDVPDDEANAVRALLDAEGFDCYETEEGRWQVGLAAIWIRDDALFDEARAVIEAYETERYREIREEQPLTFRENFLLHPLRFLMALLAVGLILLISLYPFWAEMHA